jgi:PAS domain S-box-containing protein
MNLSAPQVYQNNTQNLQQWHIFNQATIAMSKARTQSEVMQVTADNLAQMGFSLIVGQLTPYNTSLNLNFAKLSQNTFLAQIESLFKQLEGHKIPLSHLDLYQNVVENGQVSFVSFTWDEVWQVLPADIHQAVQTANINLPDKANCIIAPIRINSLTHYLSLIFAPQISPQELPLTTAFANLASAMMDNIDLLEKTQEQKTVAETLQEVSKIVGSSLELDTVLDRILEQLSKVITYNSAAILLEYGNVLKLVAGSGFTQSESRAVLDITVPIDNNPLYMEIKTEKHPIVIHDVRRDPRYTFWPGTEKIRSWIGVPLVLQNTTIGQISVDSFRINAFRNNDGNLVHTFAQHASTAIHNARLYSRTVQTTNELSVLLECARQATTTFNTQEIIHSTAERIRQLLDATGVLVYLLELDPYSNQANIVRKLTSGKLLPNTEPQTHNIAIQALESRQSLTISSPMGPNEEESDHFIGAPLISKNTTIGTIALHRLSSDPFGQNELDLLDRFILQTAVSIENSRLYEQLERRLQREALINSLSRNLSNKMSIEALAREIMQTAQSIATADAAAITLFNLNAPQQPEKWQTYSLNMPEIIGLAEIESQSGISAQAIKQKRLVLTAYYKEEPYLTPSWYHTDVEGAVAAPIWAGDEPLGVVALYNFGAAFPHPSELISTLEYVGRQVGVAIENAFLFQTVNEYAQTLEQRVRERTVELQRQKDEQAAIVESAADAIVITNAKGTVEYANQAFTSLTGYNLQEVIGLNPRVLQSGKTPESTYRDMWHTILDGRVWRGELKNKRKDGSIYDADLTIAPIFNAQDSIDKFVAIQRDISKIREVDRMKTEFLATAAHELRTPITTILGYAEILASEKIQISATETATFLNYIHEQAHHLSRLVTDLLDVSKIEAGRAFDISPKQLNPRSIFEKISQQWHEKSPHHNVELIGPPVWPELKVDSTRLEQVLHNLLSNAVKYSPQGGSIRIIAEPNPTGLRISIQDEGIGMSLDEQKHLFQRFWRANNSSTAVEGTGLGMVIVKHIIEAHGGKIWVASQKGQGTTVNFLLPTAHGTYTILLIEDERNILEIQERLLTMEGYHVLKSQTGQGGLDLAQAEHPDLIVLDLMLPEMRGEDVLKILKATPTTAAIPVFVVSAKSAFSSIENTFSLGAIDFLTKPFDIDEFLGRVKMSLTKSKS